MNQIADEVGVDPAAMKGGGILVESNVAVDKGRSKAAPVIRITCDTPEVVARVEDVEDLIENLATAVRVAREDAARVQVILDNGGSIDDMVKAAGGE
jgi:outer membrane murein-binding lipoprotein Lpp